MNGPVKMYSLKPLVNFSEEFELTTSMYKMKNIYNSNFSSPKEKLEDGALPDVLEQRPDSDVEDLKIRQKAILSQLVYLKEQMLTLRHELEKKNRTSGSLMNETEKKTIFNPNQNDKHEASWGGEIVLHASPHCPPYSLLAVSQLWPSLQLQLICYTHSSVSSLSALLAPFLTLAKKTSPSPNLTIRLIWKQMGPDCELILSPVNHCPIRGEANLLRYFHRMMNPVGNSLVEGQLDSVLDLCYRLTHTRTIRDKLMLVRCLNKHLSKSEWFGGYVMSIADIGVWSTLLPLSGVELSQNMIKWQARISAAIRIETA